MSGEDLGADWGSEGAAPAGRKPPEGFKAPRPFHARSAPSKPVPSVPTWQEAVFPSRTAAGGGINPVGLTALAAAAKDVAALPVNVISGISEAIGDPTDKAAAFRRGMVGSPGDMSQTERAIMGASFAGAPLGGLARAAIPASMSKAPVVRGLVDLARYGAAGVAESVPAAGLQAMDGEPGAALGSLAIGGTMGAGFRGVGKALQKTGSGAGNLAESMTGIPESDLRKIGVFGSSEYGQKVLSVAENRKQHVNELGDAFLDRVRNFDQYLPNAGQIDEIVKDLPDVDVNRIIASLQKAKTGIRIKGIPGTKTEGVAEVFEGAKNPSSAGSSRRMTEVNQEFQQLSGPGDLVPFSNVTRGGRPRPAGLLGMDEKGLPAIRKNPQVIPDEEAIGGASYATTTKGTSGRSVNATPESIAADAKINQLIGLLKQAKDVNGKIPAYVARLFRQRYDQVIGDAFGKESSAYVNALKNGRHEIAKALEDAAAESGKPEYAAAMKDYTTKLGALDDVMRKLGGDKKTQEDRIEAYLSNLFQGNKTNQQEAFKRLSDIMGSDFAERAQLLNDAKRIAPSGKIPLISAHKTGKAGLGGGVAGVGYGIASGNPVMIGSSLLGMGLGSPAIAPGLISAADRVSQVAGHPLAGGLARAAGRSGRAWAQSQLGGE